MNNLVTLENSALRVVLCPLGATVLEIVVKNTKKGDIDVALGYILEKQIFASTAYLGATVGRCANRIANGKFALNGVEYTLATNNASNHLHGGNVGFDKKVFETSNINDTSATFSYHSQEGEEGYPANLDFAVKYSLVNNALQIEYFAQSDNDTVFSPTNHTYFNLNGHSDGSILDNVLQLNADFFTPVDASLIPTGQIQAVDKVFDFRTPKAIGQDINDSHPQLAIAGGYDHNFCLNDNLCATAYSAKTGIKMTVWTDMKGIQFYSGNFLNGEQGKCTYNKHSGFCLETQFFPDAINQQNFADKPILHKGKKFASTTKYIFEVE